MQGWHDWLTVIHAVHSWSDQINIFKNWFAKSDSIINTDTVTLQSRTGHLPSSPLCHLWIACLVLLCVQFWNGKLIQCFLFQLAFNMSFAILRLYLLDLLILLEALYILYMLKIHSASSFHLISWDQLFPNKNPHSTSDIQFICRKLHPAPAQYQWDPVLHNCSKMIQNVKKSSID